MRKKILFFLSSFLVGPLLQGQGYTSWVTGDPSDVVAAAHQPGIVLAGGGGDNDQAMAWLLQRADEGDVVVLRASGADGYNPYFYSELGVAVNSVETIRFDGPAAATDPYVAQQIRDAEALFIAGGDQYDYYQLWKDTPIEDAINYLINEKGVTVGGTSAGMAILGGAYYTPQGSSLESAQALANPFHPNVEILGKGDFIHVPLLEDVVTDTHYDQRDRQGRHMTFLARLIHDHGVRSFGIACNEYTAVCIDETGLAQVFGEYPDYDDFAYFLKSNCQTDFSPEVIAAANPLTWNRQQSAVKVYQLPGTATGGNTFDLNDWLAGNGGEWQNWYVENGALLKILEVDGDCASLTALEEQTANGGLVKVFPNPFLNSLFIQPNSGSELEFRLTNLLGQTVWQGRSGYFSLPVDLGFLPSGNYWLEMLSVGRIGTVKVVKN
ncbi:MAG: Type 1 glutamine amidotransferase-like domain-containing protein [Lewinellaceae bacterium]|nr:Type 1 glutamine amidotransferase-like domain-containing protein [Saprospiraceae bacterium]MCB9337413.1 Type 1 glutamine amidotransferase-like domain-containing protein [Lewinellaceae bacterium]